MDTYTLCKIIPIPIYNPHRKYLYIIIPEYPYLVVFKLQYRPVAASACEEVDSTTYMCNEENILHFAKATCIEYIMLMKNNYSHCYLTTIHIENIKLF